MRSRAAFLLGLAGLLVGACASENEDAFSSTGLTGSAGGGDARDLLVDSIEKTAASESADLEMTFEIGPEGFEIAGNWDRSGVGESTAEIGGSELILRSDGDMTWISTDDPRIVAELPDGASWIEAPSSEMIDAQIMTTYESTWDPLLYLRGVDTVEDLGSEDGLHRYRATIDYEKAFEGATSDEEEALSQTIWFTEGSEVKTFDAEVSLDDEGRVRALAYDVAAGAEGGSDAPLEMKLVMDVLSFDEPVDAPEAPPADETVALSEVPAVLDLLAGTTSEEPEPNDDDEEPEEPEDEAPDPDPPPADTPADALEITTLREGSGPGAEAGDTVTVHYIGKTADGEVIDSSWVIGEPFPVELGQGMVIEGWEEGLIGAKVGERRRLVLGADMAYGDLGQGDVPPGAPLAFEVDILDIR